MFCLVCAGVSLFSPHGADVLFWGHHRSPAANWFFTYATKLGEGYVHVLLVGAFLFSRFLWSALFAVVGLASMPVANGLKSFFAQPRPWPYFEKLGMLDQLVPIEGVHIIKSSYSFPSGHTIGAFSLFALLALVLADKRWGLPLLLAAASVGVSRIYLMQHFTEDVLLGAIVGVALALALYWTASIVPDTAQSWGNRRLAFGKKNKMGQ